MKILLPIAMLLLYTLTACTMMNAWRSIPAPGGCEECHKLPIASNWQLSYRPAMLSDERGKLSFQTPQSTVTDRDKKPTQIEIQKLEQLPCFECHNAPDDTHKERKGKFHH